MSMCLFTFLSLSFVAFSLLFFKSFFFFLPLHPSHISPPEQGVPAVWGQVGSDAAHSSQAAQTGGRHQATVVRLVLVRDALCSVPYFLLSYLRKWFNAVTTQLLLLLLLLLQILKTVALFWVLWQITAYYFGAFQLHTHAIDGLSFYQQVLDFT